MTREEFIDKALKYHEEGEVDYSQTEKFVPKISWNIRFGIADM